MLSGPHIHITTPKTTVNEQPQLTLCLSMKPKAPIPGYVDRTWWPRNPNLAAGLPVLLAVLAVRLGQLRRMSPIPAQRIAGTADVAIPEPRAHW